MERNLNAGRVLSADFFDGYVFRFLQELVERNEPGLQNYYRARVLGHRGGLANYEGAMAAALDRHYPGQAVLHAGIGFGTLSALLAATGRQVIGLERDENRWRPAQELCAHLAALWPEVAARYQVLHGSFPQAVPPGAEAGRVLLFTNFIATIPEDQRAMMLASFPRYAAVVLDLRAWCTTQDSPASRAALRDEILELGMRDCGALELEGGTFYHRFEPD